jgi:hypothetical protein
LAAGSAIADALGVEGASDEESFEHAAAPKIATALRPAAAMAFR